jgi:predicted pyridoxine 5'-phosphate oxidase superfamily flavin-nucleotide-binding protein
VPDNRYNTGSLQLQERFGTRRSAERGQYRLAFTAEDRAFVERCSFFFLATVDADGSPDCSYKGGPPGFVRVIAEDTLAFPDYKGNGQFRSLGNILVSPQVALLFVDFEHPGRRRVNGVASVHAEDPLLADFPAAQLIVRVQASEIFGNCSRFIQRVQPAAPALKTSPPVPDPAAANGAPRP